MKQLAVKIEMEVGNDNLILIVYKEGDTYTSKVIKK